MSTTSPWRLLSKLRYAWQLARTRLYAWAHGIEIGPRTVIHRGARVERHGGGHIRLGQRNEIAPGAILMTYGGNIVLGDDCSVQPYSILYGHGGVHIGNGVRIAAHCTIVASNHRFERIDVPIHHQGLTTKGIRIEDDVWIASGARVLDGICIRSGTVVAAGAVVTTDTPARSVVGGVPARTLTTRGGATP